MASKEVTRENKILDVAGQLLNEPEAMALSISQAAAVYFDDCLDDFCVQHVGTATIIFGGGNRLLWTAKAGFYPDKGYCSPEFLARFEKIGPLPSAP